MRRHWLTALSSALFFLACGPVAPEHDPFADAGLAADEHGGEDAGGGELAVHEDAGVQPLDAGDEELEPPDAGDEELEPPDAGVDEPALPDAGVEIPAPTDAGLSEPAPPDAGPSTPEPPITEPPITEPPITEPPPGPVPAHTAEMTYATANIGRDYNTQAQVQAVFNHLGDVVGPKAGPKYIGWQEIGEGDPCGGTCEINALSNRFKTGWGWTTRHPRGRKPNGALERVKVPVTSKGAGNSAVRATYASAGWAGVSPTRFVTVVHYAARNVSVINTHFIAGAWSCKSHVANRRDYWRDAWRVLKAEVAEEVSRGRNVVVTGDLNRPRGANNCNPAWEPTSLHGRAKVIGGAGIDYIFAVPAVGNRFVVSTRADGTKKKGTVVLGIDGHKAHWVSGRFRPQ